MLNYDDRCFTVPHSNLRLDSETMTAGDLSVCIVAFEPYWPHLARTLARLGDAIGQASARGLISSVSVTLVNNGPAADHERLALLAEAALQRAPGTRSAVLTGHGNIGFGRGHNLGLRATAARLHLILNPDVEMDADALVAGAQYLDAHPRAGAVMAAARNAEGMPLYLAKAIPSVAVLMLRGFAPAWLRRWFQGALDRYELREYDWSEEHYPIPVAGGCFLLCRRTALEAVNGFDEGYFLYFEDYDLSMRLARTAPVGFSPAVRVIHHGGGAARKGWWHTIWFASSAARFFSTHGWRWR